MTAALWLRRPEAIRARCELIFRAAERDDLAHFRLEADRLPAVADYVLDTIRASYPDLAIPYHSRWRHFGVGGVDRWADLAGRLHRDGPIAAARVRLDLAVTSVLLDAGAGPDWRYPARDGGTYARSEGLAVASLEAFEAGAFADDPTRPLRADAAALEGLDAARLASLFRASPDNPLVGLDGRAELLRRLGARLRDAPEWFGSPGRVGNLLDALTARTEGGRLPAASLLAVVLEAFGPIWPGGLFLDGVNLGDVGRHPAAVDAEPAPGFVPFHKLSQWLAYSLVEPLEEAGLEVADLDRLTGLPEYRNGGLMLDSGLLVPRDPAILSVAHRPDSEIVVEWRALTVGLLDRVANVVRDRLGLDARSLPLARVLEGGTWAAGRRIARERRADGRPPLALDSDGTVF